MAEVLPKSLVGNFLELLGEWDYNVPLTTQWGVVIQPDAGNGLFNIIKKYTELDATGFSVSPTIQQRILGEKSNPKLDELGLYFAQSVTIPKESFNATAIQFENSGGYLNGAVGGERLDLSSKTLGITFLETNLDFGTGLIRPWIIAASYKGLINLGRSNSIKSEITIREFTRSNLSEKKPLRKYHIFKGCVPIEVNEKELKYDEEEIRIDTVSWLFEEYTYKLTM